MKKLLKDYMTYNEGSIKELCYQKVVEDEDKEMVENTITNQFRIDLNMTRGYEEFIEGKSNLFWYDLGEGIWDDPVGLIVSLTEEEAIQELTDEYNKGVEEIRKLFNSSGNY